MNQHGSLRDYRITWKPEEDSHYLELYEGSRVKEHLLCKTFDAASRIASNWICGHGKLNLVK